ncbi:MAG: Fe-S cluster assembly protein SufD, partial [Rhodospirillaceae bacterium]|nr:Fe-S cluster assembly protein SufD [Rhodospirillaceae bacterium]
GAEPVAFHPRLVIDLAPGAELTLIETHVGLPGQPYFANWVAEVALGTAARLLRAVLVDEDAEAFHALVSVAALASGARYEDFRLSLGGGKVRQDVEVRFDGRHAEAHVSGAYALARRDHHDLTTVIDHAVPHCTSTQEIKGVVAGKSHAVFQGRIQVARDAQKTNATQSHKALFLNAGPAVDCKPELEIFADDVQCAHGAATGEIDPQHLFYLMSRGLDPDTARGLLIAGFLEDATARIADPAVATAFVARIESWLKRHAVAGGAP